MNISKVLITAAAIVISSAGSFAQTVDGINYNPNLKTDTTKKSIKSRAVGIVSGDTVTINYYSPGVRGRIIWGGLVPFEQVWVTGAHSATAIEVPKPCIIAGKEIPAGTYAFFTIPGKTEWTLILNKNFEQHLADDYDAKDDIVRVVVKPAQVNHTERLQYFVEPGKNKKFTLAVAWEKIRVELPAEFK
jgi:hypothetical protein